MTLPTDWGPLGRAQAPFGQDFSLYIQQGLYDQLQMREMASRDRKHAPKAPTAHSTSEAGQAGGLAPRRVLPRGTGFYFAAIRFSRLMLFFHPMSLFQALFVFGP
jgi:hypothetical protein